MTMTTRGVAPAVQPIRPEAAGEKPIGRPRPIKKKRTGVAGFDDISEGGLPTGGVTAIVGDPGSGKTVFALQTLVNGLRLRGERGILVLFEEPEAQIRHNFASFDWGVGDIPDDDIRLIDARLPLDAVRSGVFDLSGLLSGLTTLIGGSGASNVAFDGLDMLLSSLNDEALERQEIIRLGRWVRESGVTAMLTVKNHKASERDQHRADFLQYMTDCVVVLDGILTATSFSRTIRVTKYRGSSFAANPAPFIIGPSGLEVICFGNTRLSHPTFTDRLSSGVPRLDEKLNGGYVRGTCTLVSGSPGTSKTSLASSFILSACQSVLRSLFVSFDESADQIVANMKSIGLDLEPHVRSGLLMMDSLISNGASPEDHYIVVRKLLDERRPDALVIDPISALTKMKLPFADVICERILDHAKSSGISVVCTSLLEKGAAPEETSLSNVSTIADTWMHLSYHAQNGERNRALTIVKSRGTAHSNQVCELILGSNGIEVADVYAAEGEVLMGSARQQKLARDRRENLKQELAEHRWRFDVEKCIADLKAVADKAASDLDWRQREAALHEHDQKALRESEQNDAGERLSFRLQRQASATRQDTPGRNGGGP
jgi:circadian clock protein KaiC